MTFCSHCGSRLEAGSQFCGSCGTRVTSGQPSASPGITSSAPVGARTAPPSASSSPLTHASAAPWAGGGAGRVPAPGPKKPSMFSRVPRVAYIGVAALAAIGVGAGAALSMRQTPTLPIDTTLFGQHSQALTKAPTKKWSISNDELVSSADLNDGNGGSPTVSVLDYHHNGTLLTSVSDGTDGAAVAVRESDKKILWRAQGLYTGCLPTKNGAGWVCVYTPNSSSSDDSSGPSDSSGSSEKKVVTLDSNGHRADLTTLEDGAKVYQDLTGGLWIAKGLPNLTSSSDDPSSSTSDVLSASDATGQISGSDDSSTETVSVQKLGDDGKPGWRYERNLSRASSSVSVQGLAAAPLFTMGKTTYLAGVQDTDGKGVALDGNGKPTNSSRQPVLGNDRGRLVTMKNGHLVDNGHTMKSDVSSLAAPSTTDTADVPLFDTSGSQLKRVSSGTSGWTADVSGAQPVAACGGATIAVGSDSSDQGWFLGSKGKTQWSGEMPGTPQFCWGSKQFVSLKDSTVTAQKVSDGSTAWTVDVSADSDEGSSNVTVVPSSTSDGFVAVTADGLSYWGA